MDPTTGVQLRLSPGLSWLTSFKSGVAAMREMASYQSSKVPKELGKGKGLVLLLDDSAQ